ncbi:hypothetical protein NHP190003_12080 [Helicobacter sp. NHP19-003]|uniref:Uncharacterized protein n=2 Tax=Helicobacter gastrocanis TaxID=2849641 RepID=A0ABM7SBA9_9HELI|nr:hypothetical protein NHP190003_12080 [Helicobacter sp. NHP19-003]
MNVNQLVDSISGLLGGTYGVSGDTTPSIFGASAASPIYVNNEGSATQFGTATGQISRGATTSGLNNNPQISNYNLYGQNGLLGVFGQGTNYTNPLASLGSIYSSADAYYGYRTAFAGVSASNNLLNPNAAVSNSYFTTTNGSLTGATGTLNASLLNSGTNVTTVNTFLGNLYGVIADINKNITVSGSGNTVPTYVADYGSSGVIGSTGQAFLSALSSSSSSALSSSLDTLSSALGLDTSSGSQGLITSSTSNLLTTYSVSTGALGALSALNTLNSLVNNGIVTTTTSASSTGYVTNPNYTAAMTLYNITTKKAI